MKTNLELFCGSAGFTKVSRCLGMNCISVDNRYRKGTCEPDVKMDISTILDSELVNLDLNFLWIGLPCDIWSNASGKFHIDKNLLPQSQKAIEHIQLLHVIANFIKITKPKFFFLENPRGRLGRYLQKHKEIFDFDYTVWTTSLDVFGFPVIKPTQIFTNSEILYLPPVSRFGRGNKNFDPRKFDNMTKVQRQKTPENLYYYILEQHSEFFL